MYKVLFVCSGNTCRSPLAMALFQKAVDEDADLKGKVQAGSCGTSTHYQEKVEPNAVEAGRKLDVDISQHRSNCFAPEFLGEFDLIVCMTKAHRDTINARFSQYKDKVKAIYEFVTGEIDCKNVQDPFGCDQNTYDKIAGELNDLVHSMVEKIKTLI